MATVARRSVWQRHIALTQEHGSWVFLFSPLLIGLFAGGRFTLASVYLIVTALAAFLVRQPITVIVKVRSRRRSAQDLPAAYFWTAVYSVVGLLGFAGLWSQGAAYVAVLAIPGIPVFLWHLALVARRAERRQIGVEIIASGVLALAAPAAYWIGMGRVDAMGWGLWGLTWIQSAASIVYAALRLEQRTWKTAPPQGERLRAGRRALLYTTFNLLVVLLLSVLRILPPLLPLAYAVQWIESIYGTLRPAIGVKPTRIGVRQLLVSVAYTLLFIVTWSLAANALKPT